MSTILAAVVIASTASACAPREYIRVRRVVATPIPTPTPKPTPSPSAPPKPSVKPATSATSPAPAGSPGQAAIVATIERVFGPAAAPGAERVANCESGDGPSHPGPPYHIDPTQTSGPNWGAFQVNVYVHAARIARLGFTREQMLEIGPNAVVAHDLWTEQGWAPWSCGWAA